MPTTFDIDKYDPLPTLKLFHESNADMRAMVGPVGSGKTSAASWEIFYYLPFHLAERYSIKKTRWAIIRNTYRELMDTTQKTIFEWFPWGDHKKGDQIYILKYPKHDIEIEALFRSCDRPQDLKKFKSLEITGYWIDESIEVSEEIKRMLKNRIGRYPRKSSVRYGIETTNPPDIEHLMYFQFDYKTPVPGPLPERKTRDQQILKEHEGFWQPPKENEANLRKGYYTDLIMDYAGNPDWIERYVEGKPGVTVAGKPVHFNFKRSFHVAEEPLVWTKGPLFAGWDNTGNCPACVIVQQTLPGFFQALKEYHTERMGIVDFVQMVVADRNTVFPDAEWTEWGDPAGEAKFSKVGGGLTSNAELMRDEAGILLKASEQNWEARRESVESQLGKLVGGEPGLVIDPSCTRLINGFIGGYCYPEIGTTSIYRDTPLKNKYSHVHDALQYVMVMLTKNVRRTRRRNERQNRKRPHQLRNWRDKMQKPDEGFREVMVG